ncbi:MAG: hypothetical protein IT357_08650 [Gemmatimonadaceae bacterium]|nr:hypothetical protein [Gemmatimonadaceae bacterium]
MGFEVGGLRLPDSFGLGVHVLSANPRWDSFAGGRFTTQVSISVTL